jgi:hypothetical protein
MKKNIALIIFVAVTAFVVNTLHHAGSFKKLEPHSSLTDISVYTNMAGPEDIEIDRAKGLLFISSSDRWNAGNGGQSQDGIYLLGLNIKSQPVKLATNFAGELHPHGLSFLSIDGRDYLFVVNHNQAGNFIELFEFKENMLFHLRSLLTTTYQIAFASAGSPAPNLMASSGTAGFYMGYWLNLPRRIRSASICSTSRDPEIRTSGFGT